MTSLKLSIITICYNAANGIERTLRSVTEQSYPNIEYIIIDGASKDNTMDIVRRYADKISTIVSERDKGIYDAMNKGLAKATGDYVWFMNAGDCFYGQDVVANVAKLATEKGFDILYGETAIINDKGEQVAMRRLKAPKQLTWRSFIHGMLVCHQSFVVKRALADPYDMQYRFSADVDWCIRCMKKTKQIGNTQQILSCYLEEGATTANHKASLKERFHIMAHHYGWLPVAAMHLWFAVRFHWAKYTKGRV